MIAKNKAINTLAIISSLAIVSSVFMIVSSILKLYLWSDAYVLGWKFYIQEVIMSLIHILFTIYVITCFYKKRFRICGIIVTVLNLLGYPIINTILLYGHINVLLLNIIPYLIEIPLVFIFCISLYKKFSIIADIVNTIVLLINVAVRILEIMCIFSITPIFSQATYGQIFSQATYSIGFLIFLLTVYLMSFFQTPLCDNKERLGSSFMIGGGIFLTILGFFLVGYGNSVNNDVSAQMESFFDSGKTGTGDSIIVIGVLIAIFGIVLLVTGIVKAIQKDKQIAEKNKYSVCRRCGFKIESSAKFCNNCGESVSEIKLCSKCNSQQPKDAKFCGNCGFSFENNDNN